LPQRHIERRSLIAQTPRVEPTPRLIPLIEVVENPSGRKALEIAQFDEKQGGGNVVSNRQPIHIDGLSAIGYV
jgi:hypothetical protein